MDLEGWKKLLAKSEDDATVKAALTAAGVKKIPKLDDDDTDVRFDLKGHGLWLLMTDEAFLKKLDDQDIGEGPLVLSGVSAYLDQSVSRDVYKDPLPYKVAPGMSQTEVRKLLGRRSSVPDDPQVDVWSRDRLKIIARYTRDLKLITSFGLFLPGAE
jgi:hypothetical protein